MRIPWLPLLALAAAGPEASALELVHEPLSCAAPGRYPLVGARAVPAEGVAAAELRFRAAAGGGWYVVRMRSSHGQWTAWLPRPLAALPRFEYEVALTGADAREAATGPIAVEVRDDCPAGVSAVAEAIAVQVPAGAPAVPPVPAGFNPIGASVPHAERRQAAQPAKGGFGTRVALGVGLAGVAGGATAVASRREDAITPSPDDASQRLPAFTFTGTVPAEGATVSRRRDAFGVIVTMDREPSTPLPIQFNIGLQNLVNGTRCANMEGTFEGAQRPLGLVLTGPVVPAPGGPCGDSYEIRALVLQVRANQRPVIQGTVPLVKALRFDP